MLWLLRGSWGVRFVSCVCILNDRFWWCLKSHVTIPLLNKAMEADAIKSEEDATKAYEGFVKDY